MQAKFLDILHLVAWNGYGKEIDVCAYLCKDTIDNDELLIGLRDIQDRVGNTRLHRAILRRDYGLASRVLELGANPNILNYHFESPIYLAVKENNLHLVDLLIQHGVDVNENHRPKNLLDILLYEFQFEPYRVRPLLYRLLDHPDICIEDAMYTAAAIGDVERLSRFIEEKGGDPKAKDRHGESPIEAAVSYQQFNTIKYLLDNFDINVEEEVPVSSQFTRPIILLGLFYRGTDTYDKILHYMAHKTNRPNYWLLGN